jgi:hypothetical protein
MEYVHSSFDPDFVRSDFDGWTHMSGKTLFNSDKPKGFLIEDVSDEFKSAVQVIEKRRSRVVRSRMSIAWAMGLHARLGNDSLLNVLDDLTAGIVACHL